MWGREPSVSVALNPEQQLLVYLPGAAGTYATIQHQPSLPQIVNDQSQNNGSVHMYAGHQKGGSQLGTVLKKSTARISDDSGTIAGKEKHDVTRVSFSAQERELNDDIFSRRASFKVKVDSMEKMVQELQRKQLQGRNQASVLLERTDPERCCPVGLTLDKRKQSPTNKSDVATIQVVLGNDGNAVVQRISSTEDVNGLLCDSRCKPINISNAKHHGPSFRNGVGSALANALTDVEFELRTHIASLKTTDGQKLMNVCPEIKIVLDAYSKALDKAKSEAGLTEGRDRASQVAILPKTLSELKLESVLTDCLSLLARENDDTSSFKMTDSKYNSSNQR
ncbi:uncharacterized protein LOC111254121 [Varroa destructor]|uniref:Uncharacterized protein n=1 Tax=Varroa destructor TaxID=109461 RepID=A0A7M7KXC1_VARDE|nr:uncharacterized protein LOC111254121 [Varroa destructor]XP_022670389.1 uncharacterized protein LOC111254121 [Varroa destructor]